jgi:hypothetical protein
LTKIAKIGGKLFFWDIWWSLYTGLYGRKKEARLFNLMKNLRGKIGRRRRRRRRTYYPVKGRHLWCVLLYWGLQLAVPSSTVMEYHP